MQNILFYLSASDINRTVQEEEIPPFTSAGKQKHFSPSSLLYLTLSMNPYVKISSLQLSKQAWLRGSSTSRS